MNAPRGMSMATYLPRYNWWIGLRHMHGPRQQNQQQPLHDALELREKCIPFKSFSR